MNEPEIDWDKKTITVPVLEKKVKNHAEYTACVYKPNPGLKDSHWENTKTLEQIWDKARAAVKTFRVNNQLRCGPNWKVTFKHRIRDDRCRQLNWTEEHCRQQEQEYDKRANGGPLLILSRRKR